MQFIYSKEKSKIVIMVGKYEKKVLRILFSRSKSGNTYNFIILSIFATFLDDSKMQIILETSIFMIYVNKFFLSLVQNVCNALPTTQYTMFLSLTFCALVYLSTTDLTLVPPGSCIDTFYFCFSYSPIED